MGRMISFRDRDERKPTRSRDFPELFNSARLADVTANLTIDLGKGIPQETACRGQRDLPCGAVKQAKPQLLLQRCNLLGDCLLADIEIPGGGGKAQAVCHL